MRASAAQRQLSLLDEARGVVISGRREREGHEVVDEIKRSGGDAIFVQADVSKEPNVVATIQRTLATFGRLDLHSTTRASSRR